MNYSDFVIDTTLAGIIFQNISIWDNIANISNIASLLGLAIAVYLILNARYLRNRYLSILRTPKLLKKLKRIGSNILELIYSDNFDEVKIRTELNIYKSNLKSIHTKLDRSSRKECKVLMKTIDSILGNDSIDIDEFWDIFEKISGFNEVVGNFIEDLNWRL